MTNVQLTFSATLYRFDEKMGYHYFQVPHEVAITLSETFPFRSLCTINHHTFHAGIVKRGIDGFVIQIGKAVMKAAKIQYQETFNVHLQPDVSEYGYAFPEEMQELLNQDEESRKYWDSMNPGAKRSYLHYVNSGKSIDTRIKRSLLIIERAKELYYKKKK
jgi:hypothetical protein